MKARDLSSVNLELLRVFHRVAEKGSMTEAAKSLFITQPAVSHAVAQLEERLGEKLFERRGRSLALTAAGGVIFRAANEMAAALARGERDLEKLHWVEESNLTVGAPYLVLHQFLVPWLSLFHRRYPGVKIRVKIENRMSEMPAIAKKGMTDIFFITSPKTDEVDADLESEKIASLNYCFLASREHYGELEGKPLSLSDINQLPIAVLSKGHSTRHFFEARFADEGLEMNVCYDASTMAVVEDLTRAGLGIGAMVREGSSGSGLFELKLKRQLEPGVIHAAWRKGRQLTPAAAAFLELVRAEVQKA